MDTDSVLQLVLQAKEDPDAFAKLYNLYVEKIYSFTAFRVGDRATAEDLTSTIWEKIFLKLKNFTPNHENSFKVWAYRIAHNTIIDYYRSSGHRETVSIDDAYDLHTKNDGPKEDAEYQLTLTKMKNLLEKLPRTQREIANLRIFSELSNKEIAEIIGSSEKTVASNFCRALKQLNSDFNQA